MKAIVHRRYGSPDELRYEEIEKPAPGDGEVLIEVHAAAVNPLDWHVLRGRPYFVRLGGGLRRPKSGRLGADLAGRVEAVGGGVTRLRPGDEVFGAKRGAFAEYVCAPEGVLAPKPANLTFEQAAALPVAALTALQGLRQGRIQAGRKVLINGAAGGVGTFAVQIARSHAAEVTAVCSTRNVDLVRSIGADRVVDYTREDFTRGAERYDLVLDCVGSRSPSACRRVMSRQGIYVGVGGPDGRWLGPLAHLLAAVLLSPFVSQSLGIVMASVRREDLLELTALVEAGKVTPVIDRLYPLSEAAAAIRYLEAGHARGKVVLRAPAAG